MKNFSKNINRFFERLTFSKAIIILLVLGCLIYGGTLRNPFVHDDFVFIVGNPDIGRWDDLKDIFFKPSRFGESHTIINQYYRPVLDIFCKIQYMIFSFNPAGYHLTNLIFHILNSLLVYWIFVFFIKNKKLSLVGASIFLVHPVQTEAVCAIAGISNLLLTFFCLLSFIFYIKACQSRANLNFYLRYAFSLVIFSVVLFLKERAVIFPFLILFFESYVYNSQSNIKFLLRRFLYSIPFFVVLIGHFVFREFALGKAFPQFFSNPQELILRVISIPKAILVYFKILIFPIDLHYYRSLNILDYSVYPSIALLLLIVVFLFILRLLSKQNRRIFYFGVGWFFISLLPILNIVPLINEYSFISAAEHFLYFPLVGFILALLAILKEIKEKFSSKYFSRISSLFSIIIIFLFSILTIRQGDYWKGEIPLFERTLVFQKDFGRVRILLARAYYFGRNYDKAIEEYHKALEIMHGYVFRVKGTQMEKFYLSFVKEIYFDLAHCYENKGDFHIAIEEYQKCLIIDPFDSKILGNIGTAYFYLERIDEAISYHEKALKIDPQDILALNNLAICYIQRNEFKKAEEILQHVLTLDPNLVSAQKNLNLLIEMKKNKP